MYQIFSKNLIFVALQKKQCRSRYEADDYRKLGKLLLIFFFFRKLNKIEKKKPGRKQKEALQREISFKSQSSWTEERRKLLLMIPFEGEFLEL